MFGNLVGRSAHFLISGGRHYPVIFTALVGPTASGRRGTALHSVLPVFERLTLTGQSGASFRASPAVRGSFNLSATPQAMIERA